MEQPYRFSGGRAILNGLFLNVGGATYIKFEEIHQLSVLPKHFLYFRCIATFRNQSALN